MATQAELAEVIERKTRKATPEDLRRAITKKKLAGTLIDTITGAGEANEVAQTLLSGAAAVPVSGLVGGATLTGPVGDAAGLNIGPEARKNLVEGVQDALTIDPITPGAKDKLQTLGDLVESGIDLARIPLSKMGEFIEMMTGRSPEEAAQVSAGIKENGFSQTYADSVLEKTGDPLLASLAYAVPQIIPELIGNRILNRAPTDLEVRVAEKIKADQPVESPVSEPPVGDAPLEAAPPEPVPIEQPVESVQRRILDGAGRRVDNRALDAAVKQGMSPVYAALIQGSPAADKAKIGRMVEVIKDTRKDPRVAIRNRPSNVVGESVLERYNYVKRVNEIAGRQLDEVAKRDLIGQPFDVSKPGAAFMDALDNLGVTVTRGEAGVKVGFKDSDLAPGDQGPIKRVIEKIARMRGVDAYDAHTLKRFIDNQVTFGKSKSGSISRDAENALKEFRANIDGQLDATFDAYNEVNTKYADTIKAIDGLRGVAGRKTDLNSPLAKQSLGILMRRPTSNAMSGGRVLDAVDNLEAVARKYDGVFDDSLDTQMLLVQELERLIPPSGRTSLRGEETLAKIDAAKSMQGKGAAELTADAAGNLAKRFSGVNEENAIKAIEQLLKEQ